MPRGDQQAESLPSSAHLLPGVDTLQGDLDEVALVQSQHLGLLGDRDRQAVACAADFARDVNLVDILRLSVVVDPLVLFPETIFEIHMYDGADAIDFQEAEKDQRVCS
ncbi:hypothetical protein [Methanomethylophilus alvi]|uniref:hypothetical protein n=1 Tax=Methanomethylophilus alvi TaxID=1291540 RepID=UPI0037DDB87F